MQFEIHSLKALIFSATGKSLQVSELLLLLLLYITFLEGGSAMLFWCCISSHIKTSQVPHPASIQINQNSTTMIFTIFNHETWFISMLKMSHTNQGTHTDKLEWSGQQKIRKDKLKRERVHGFHTVTKISYNSLTRVWTRVREL